MPPELLETARSAAHAAAAVHQGHAGRVDVSAWSRKGTADFVTHVDREAEAEIARVIRARHPSHALLAEEAADEGAAVDADAEWLWIVDPLDGTTNYLHGYPMYAASVAVAHRGVIVASAVVAPALDEEWTACAHGGAFCNGERMRVSPLEGMDQALIGTGFPFKQRERIGAYLVQFERVLRASAGVRRAGSAALDLCHVAGGRFDGFWELSLAPWDIAAGILLVQEAGGLITRLDGPLDVTGHGSVVAGNPNIHAALEALLRGEDDDG